MSHFFAAHALGYAKGETREEAIDTLLKNGALTDPKWVNRCARSGDPLTIFSCRVPGDIDEGYSIQWYQPQVEGVTEGRNDEVLYATKSKYVLHNHCLMDVVSSLKQELKDREAQLRTLAYAITAEGSKRTPEMQKLLKECFDDEVLFPKSEEDAA